MDHKGQGHKVIVDVTRLSNSHVDHKGHGHREVMVDVTRLSSKVMWVTRVKATRRNG